MKRRRHVARHLTTAPPPTVGTFLLAQGPELAEAMLSGNKLVDSRGFHHVRWSQPGTAALAACDACGPAGEVALRAGCRVCKTCSAGSSTAETVARAGGQEEVSELERLLKHNVEMLRKTSNLWSFGVQDDPGHEPAWKKRRRL